MTDVSELIQRLTGQDDAACEAEAIRLGRQGEEGLATLQALLASDEVDARFWALRGLWANGSPKAVKLLIIALGDEAEMVRSGAAFALGELGSEAAVEPLLQLLIQDVSETGDHAADALVKIGQPAAAGLIEALQQTEAGVRVRAARALVPIKSRQAIGPLFHALEDESYMVRHYAETALERMGVGQMVYFQP
jgi:HEAT repeat protein